MNTVLLIGMVLTGVGLVGYVTGISMAFPGRAFSVTAVMVGLTLVAIGRSYGRTVGT